MSKTTHSELTIAEIEQKLADAEDAAEELETLRMQIADIKTILTWRDSANKRKADQKTLNKHLTKYSPSAPRRKAKESFKTFERRKQILAGIKPKKRRKTTKKHNGRPGKLRTCVNPDCQEVSGRKSRDFIAHTPATYCGRKCQNHVANRLRAFCDIVYDADEKRISRYLTSYPWLKAPEFKKRADKLMKLVERYRIKQARRNSKNKKGTILSRNTPTASVPYAPTS